MTSPLYENHGVKLRCFDTLRMSAAQEEQRGVVDGASLTGCKGGSYNESVDSR